MTKKEFVLQVVDQLLENPRKVLAGHGIKGAVLQQILRRPDIMAKLATVLYSLKTAKKGAVGLKKAANFQIKGYKNFPEMNMNAREDIEAFIGGLSGDDQATFNNADNILTILMLPDTQQIVPGEEGDEVVNSIITGKSVMLPFDSAVRNEYKIRGGVYVVVMIGNSAIRPAEEKLAARKEKVNKRKQVKRTPARIKMELKRKANKKLEILKAQRARLQDTAYNTRMEMQQSAYLEDALGNEDIVYGVGKNNMRASNYGINRAGILAGLSAEDKAIYAVAQKLNNKGNKAAAKAVLRTMKNPVLLQAMNGTAPVSGDSVVNSRKAALRKQIKDLMTRNEQLLLDLSLAPAQKRLSIKSMISKNNASIKALRARMGTYKNLSAAGKANKAAMLQQVNAAIQENISAGNSITQALNAAIAELDAKPQQKQIIKQQVMQQVAEGMPMQFAVQQAIQDNYVDETVADSTLTGDYDIESLLASL